MSMPPVILIIEDEDFLRSSLADYLEFTVGDPAINRDLGWPSIVVQP